MSATHVYGDAITHTASLTVTDASGGSQTTKTFQVVVSDVAPAFTATLPDVIVGQGATLSLPSIGFSDPTFAETSPSYTPSFTYTIDWGDSSPASTGTANISQVGANGTPTLGDFTGSHVYTSANTYTVTLKIDDHEGQTTTETFAVQVVVPVIQPVPTQTVAEGSTLTLSGATFTDPDPSGSYTALIDWGDGTTPTAATIAPTSTPGTFSVSDTHVYGDAITHTASLTVTDNSGGSQTTQTFQVVVTDVAPTFTATLPDVIVGQGATLSLPSIGFSDPTFAETSPSYTPSFTYTIDWGDSSPASTGTANISQVGANGTPTLGDFTGSHVYTSASTYTVTVKIDDHEGQTTTETFTVQVVVPVIQPVPTQTVAEGSTLSLSGATFTDPDPSGSYTALIDWGDGTTPTAATIAPTSTPGTFTVSATHVYGDAITHTASLTVTDNSGGSQTTQTFQVVVTDVAPTFTTTEATGTLNEGSVLPTGSIRFTDPTFAESKPSYTPSFTYTINWGDGSSQTLSIPASEIQQGSATVLTQGTIQLSHLYGVTGVYTATITITDAHMGSVKQSFVVNVLDVTPTLNVAQFSELSIVSTTMSSGQTFDPGTNPLTITVTWGDNMTTVFAVSGAALDNFNLSHIYFGPPNPLNPSAAIPVSVTVSERVGSSVTENFLVQVPGTGVAIVTFLPEPTAPPLPAPQAVLTEIKSFYVEAPQSVAAASEPTPARGEIFGAVEDQVVLRSVFPSGKEGDNILLPANVLDNLPGYLKRLPDGHFRIYLVQGDTRRERLIIDVNVRQGRPVDAGDDSEGTQDRPPSAVIERRGGAEGLAAVSAASANPQLAGRPILSTDPEGAKTTTALESLGLPASQAADDEPAAGTKSDSSSIERHWNGHAWGTMNGHIAMAALAWAGARRTRQPAAGERGLIFDRSVLSKAARLMRRVRKEFDDGSR